MQVHLPLIRLELPPFLFLFSSRTFSDVAVVSAGVAGEGVAAADHLVDLAPVGDAADVAVVDPHIDLELAGEVVVVDGTVFLGIVTVDSIELDTSFATPLDGFVEEGALADAPQDEAVMVGYQHLERLCCKGTLFADSRILMFDDGSVEIYCDSHYNSQLTIHNS